MAEKVLMFALSPTMETGTIVKWNVQEVDTVSSGDVLCEVETDKAVMDYEIMQEGTLLKIVLPEGGEAQVGDTIAILGEKGEDISSLLAEAQSEPESTSLPVQEAKEEKAAAPVIAPSEITVTPERGFADEKLRSSPLARRMAQEVEIALETIRGSGPGGRIIKRDIEAALQTKQAGISPVSAVPEPISVPALTDETIQISQKRKIIARRLAESKNTAPHYYLKVSVNMGEVLEARKTLNSRIKEKVSMNAFLIKFAAEALKKHSAINSTWNGETITRHGRVDIGLAVAQSDGLITPIVRNCGHKGILIIDQELRGLIQKAHANRLDPEEYTGATFTISSLGAFGIRDYTAIINPPGSAILAIGEIRKEPVVDVNDQIVIQSQMIMTLSCDHRVIDGAVGAAFLTELKDMLEYPIRVLY